MASPDTGGSVNNLTLNQWKRRALKAEAELESIKKIRLFDFSQELKMHEQMAACKTALKEIKDAIEWAESIGAEL